jgi:hypothetical protein
VGGPAPYWRPYADVACTYPHTLTYACIHVTVHIHTGRTQLLDTCVKNCGYPLHKQVGSKKFLNGLVRQFTERPPVRLAPLGPASSHPHIFAVGAPRRRRIRRT